MWCEIEGGEHELAGHLATLGVREPKQRRADVAQRTLDVPLAAGNRLEPNAEHNLAHTYADPSPLLALRGIGGAGRTVRLATRQDSARAETVLELGHSLALSFSASAALPVTGLPATKCRARTLLRWKVGNDFNLDAVPVMDESEKTLCFGGRRGIRTHGERKPSPVFKTGALNHSASLPDCKYIA